MERTSAVSKSAAPVAPPRRSVALVLSGGGARGAYAVGVVSGLDEILGGVRSKFDVITGASVGAIHAAHFAAHAHQRDLGVAALERQWEALTLETHLRSGLNLSRRVPPRVKGAHLSGGSAVLGRALLDARPFERIVLHDLPWELLHANIRSGYVRALLISALRVNDGRTVTFAELAPGAQLVVSRDPRRDASIGPISGAHVLASAALPLLFPARRIGDFYYCDGGLRSNTPVAPAIRAGAEDLVVIALRSGRPKALSPGNGSEKYPSPVFLLGKILDALLLDPIDYDLQVLARLNGLLEVMEETIPPVTMDRIRTVLATERGLPYRRLRPLVFRPSQDIGVLAGDFMASRNGQRRAPRLATLLLRHAASLGNHMESDLLSYLLFDGEFARLLMDLGRRDALGRAREIRAFFGSASARPSTGAFR